MINKITLLMLSALKSMVQKIKKIITPKRILICIFSLIFILLAACLFIKQKINIVRLYSINTKLPAITIKSNSGLTFFEKEEARSKFIALCEADNTDVIEVVEEEKANFRSVSITNFSKYTLKSGAKIVSNLINEEERIKAEKKAEEEIKTFTLKQFETNKIYITSYSYTDTKYPDHFSNGEPICYYSGASDKDVDSLIPIYDNTHKEVVNGKEYIIHSIASDTALLPYGSIIYIAKLNMYFRVDDDCGSNKYTKVAHNNGCSIWADIYIGKAAFEGKSGILDYGNGINTDSGNPNKPKSNNIVWADGKNNFTNEQLKIINDFYNNYYSSGVWTFELIRFGK